MNAVIPAAGLGNRFHPYTKAMPKERIPIVDKPAIQFVVEEAVASGMREILIVTGRSKRAIEDHFDANLELDEYLAKSSRPGALDDLEALMKAARIMYVRQSSPRGLGDAVLRAADFVADEPFGLLLGDDITVNPPCAGVLRAVHEKLGRSVIAVEGVPRDRQGRYGLGRSSAGPQGIRRPVSETVLADPVEPDAAHLLRVQDPTSVDDDRRRHRGDEVLWGQAGEGRPVRLEDRTVGSRQRLLRAPD